MNPISDTSSVLMAAILSMDVDNRDTMYGSAYLHDRSGELAVGAAPGSATLDAWRCTPETEFGSLTQPSGTRIAPKNDQADSHRRNSSR